MLTNEEVKQLAKFFNKTEDIIQSVGESKVDDRDRVLSIISKWLMLNHTQLSYGNAPADLFAQKS